MSTRKKRSTANSSKGASSSLEEELSPSNSLTQGEEPTDPNANQPRPNHDVIAAKAKAAYEVELAKLQKEADEVDKTKKRLLAVQQEVDAAKGMQRQKAEIAKLQEELRIIKAKQYVNFNQPSPEYSVPIHSTHTEGNMPFTQPPPYTTFNRNPFGSGPSNQDTRTIRTRSWDPKSPVSQEIQITPWPQPYRPLPLPRFSGQSDPR
jgi:hypothetical protein